MCTITQDDLGPSFEDVDADLADLAIEVAKTIVLGPIGTQSVVSLRWTGCGVDPCLAIRLLASHILVTNPASGAAEGPATASESIGDVSVTYAGTSSSSSIYGGSSQGLLFAQMLAAFEKCQGKRRCLPIAYGPVGVT